MWTQFERWCIERISGTEPGICLFTESPPQPNERREASCEVPRYECKYLKLLQIILKVALVFLYDEPRYNSPSLPFFIEFQVHNPSLPVCFSFILSIIFITYYNARFNFSAGREPFQRSYSSPGSTETGRGDRHKGCTPETSPPMLCTEV